MFKKEDFELPLEKQLRMRVIQQEINDCNDINVLKEQLITCADTLMQYQHLLAKAVEANLHSFLNDLSDTMGIEISKESDG